MKKKYIWMPLAVLAIAATTLFGVARTYAQSTPAEQAKYPAIVQKIADKFNLQIADVQAVFDQDKTDRQAEMQIKMQAKFEERLAQAVTDGKLTEVQKQAIIAKRAELQTTMQSGATNLLTENSKNMTAAERQAAQAERKTAMEAQRTELETWAKQNGIEAKYLVGLGGFGFGSPGGDRGFDGGHGFGRMGMPDSDQPSTQQQSLLSKIVSIS